MNVISFNILFKDLKRKIVLTESPYLLVNDDLSEIIKEIRNIVKTDFKVISEDMQIPMYNLAIGMTTYANNKVHFFEIDINKLKNDKI